MSGEQLIKRETVTEFVETYQRHMKILLPCLLLTIRTAREMTQNVDGVRYLFMPLYNHHQNCNVFEEMERRISTRGEAEAESLREEKDKEALRRVETGIARQYWRSILFRADITKVVTPKVLSELTDQIEKGEMPPLTVDNVLMIANNLYKAAPDMLAASVMELYDSLKPRHTCTKTNNKVPEIGEKIILPYMCRTDYSAGGIRYDSDAKIEHLEKLLDRIEGRKTNHENGWSEVYTAQKSAEQGSERWWEGETHHLKWKACKNGNLHLWFRNATTLRELNRMISKATEQPRLKVAS